MRLLSVFLKGFPQAFLLVSMAAFDACELTGDVERDGINSKAAVFLGLLRFRG
jgi:hypothetical protein